METLELNYSALIDRHITALSAVKRNLSRLKLWPTVSIKMPSTEKQPGRGLAHRPGHEPILQFKPRSAIEKTYKERVMVEYLELETAASHQINDNL